MGYFHKDIIERVNRKPVRLIEDVADNIPKIINPLTTVIFCHIINLERDLKVSLKVHILLEPGKVASMDKCQSQLCK